MQKTSSQDSVSRRPVVMGWVFLAIASFTIIIPKLHWLWDAVCEHPDASPIIGLFCAFLYFVTLFSIFIVPISLVAAFVLGLNSWRHAKKAAIPANRIVGAKVLTIVALIMMIAFVSFMIMMMRAISTSPWASYHEEAFTWENEWETYTDTTNVSFEYAADWIVCPWELSEATFSTLYLIKGITTCPTITQFGPELNDPTMRSMPVSISDKLYDEDADYASRVNRLSNNTTDPYNSTTDLREFTFEEHQAICYSQNSEMAPSALIYEIYLPAHRVTITDTAGYGTDCAAWAITLGRIIKNFS